MRRCLTVNVTPSYELTIGRRLISDPELIRSLRKDTEQFVIITDSTVNSLYATVIHDSFAKFNPLYLELPAGEIYKSRETKQQLEDQMLAAGCNRDTCIIAIGGGVVSDISGFVAATYCRGIPMVFFPTTLLAMVDASVGGKTAVNTPYGKNMIGAFHQPSAVYMDVDFLDTLPVAELENGLAEMIKHALIMDKSQLSSLMAQKTKYVDASWLLKDKDWLIAMLADTVSIKKTLVASDERDYGARQLLNFGHTLGHAVEQLSHYTIPHGQAVAIGMLIESYLGVVCKVFPAAQLPALEQALELCSFSLYVDCLHDTNAVLAVLKLDKKARADALYTVLLTDLGTSISTFTHPVSPQQIEQALRWYNARVADNRQQG